MSQLDCLTWNNTELPWNSADITWEEACVIINIVNQIVGSKKQQPKVTLTPKEKKFLETKEKKIEELRIEKDKLEKKSEELIQESKELTQEINKLKSEKKSKQKQEEINIQISNKNSILIDQILNTQQELYKADTEEKKSALRKRKTELFKQIESNKKGNSHRYLKEVRETISKGFKKLNLQDLKEKYAELYNKGEELYNSDRADKVGKVVPNPKRK